METNSEPKPKKFTQSDFRLLLGKQLISGYTGRKVNPTYQPLFVGPDITTEHLVNHENCKLTSSRGCTCRYHKRKFGTSKRTIFSCNACRVFLCKDCHYLWHQTNQVASQPQNQPRPVSAPPVANMPLPPYPQRRPSDKGSKKQVQAENANAPCKSR